VPQNVYLMLCLLFRSEYKTALRKRQKSGNERRHILFNNASYTSVPEDTYNPRKGVVVADCSKPAVCQLACNNIFINKKKLIP